MRIPFLLSFAFASSLFSYSNYTFVRTDLIGNNGTFSECLLGNPYKYLTTTSSTYDTKNVYWHTDIVINKCSLYKNVFVSNVTCPTGTTVNGQGYCQDNTCVPPDIVDEVNRTCYTPPPYLPDYDGNPDACHEHGGWVLINKCVSEEDFWRDIENGSENYIIGTGLQIGGALLTAAGLIALPFTGGLSAGLIATGTHAYVAGALYMGINNSPLYSDSAGSMGNSKTINGNTIAIDLINYTPSDGSPAMTGQAITKNDDANKRVTESYYIPDPVLTQMADRTAVDYTTDSRTTPIDLTGVQKNTYDYTNNTVTSQTMISPTQARTEIAPFSVTQNADSSIKATPIASSPAPTVSGGGGGSVGGTVEAESQWMQDIQAGYRESQKYWDDIAAGYNPSTDMNVTTPISNTDRSNADIITKLDEIKTSMNAGQSPDLSDKSSDFASLDTEVKGSFSGFIYTDPLGINSLGTGNIPTYSFSLYGRNFVVFNEAMLSSLPLDLIRGLFLFIAALLGFITVISGV